jgi:CubicO group peptidase (beta-lactamase class C family)
MRRRKMYMHKQKRITGIIALSILLAINLTMSSGCSGSNKNTSAQTSEANESVTTTAAISETDGTTQEKTIEETFAFIDDSGFQGTVLIAKGGEIVFEKSYKYSNIESQTLNTNNTIYEIGSITKQFTAVGLMMLVEDGKINLDDTLDKYIPEYSHAGEVTIRQLLNMTSGIVEYLTISNKPEAYDFATVLSLVDTYDLEFVPGSSWVYSNTGYCFISEVIARVSGMTYEDYMMKNVLAPAGLKTASFEPDQNTSTGYSALTLIEMPDVDVTGEGGLRMTADDLFAWTQVIINQELLSGESWNEILNGGEFGYGFGIQIQKDNWGHGGATWGFSSSEFVYTQSNVVIITLSNIEYDVVRSVFLSKITDNMEVYFDLN